MNIEGHKKSSEEETTLLSSYYDTNDDFTICQDCCENNKIFDEYTSILQEIEEQVMKIEKHESSLNWFYVKSAISSALSLAVTYGHLSEIDPMSVCTWSLMIMNAAGVYAGDAKLKKLNKKLEDIKDKARSTLAANKS